MTYAALFVGASPTAPSPRVVIPVFQRTYCWSDQQVLGWWRDAAMRGGHSAMRVKGGHATGRCLFRRAREGRPEERTDAGADTEGEGEDEDASPLLCLDGQQRCTTTLLAVAAIRDAALTLLARDADVEDDTRTRTVVERAERALYADAAGARRWIRDRVAEKSDDDASYPEGARPPFATTLLPSFVDRAAFFRCIVGGALAFARGERSPRSPPGRSPRSPGSRTRDTSSTPMCRAKATLDAAASSLLVPRATASVRLAAALDAMLEETRLTYVEIQGDAVNLAQAFQWLQEKTLFAAGAVLWNPAPGVHLAGSDLIRNAILAVFLRRSLREQESAYRDAWLDPLERRVSRAGPGGSKSLDDAFRAFLVDDARARGARAPARWRCAFERDLEAMMASDATPERLRETVGEGSPAWIYARFQSFVEEIALARAGEDDAARAARSARINLGVGGGARRDFDFTTSAPPAKYEPEHAEEGHVPEEIDEETRKTRKNDETRRATNATSATRPSTRAPWEGPAPTGIPVEGTDANVDAAARAAAAVPVTERACRDALDRVVAFAERAGFFGSEDAEKERECRYAERYQ